MDVSYNPVVVVNLVLATVIMLLGYWGYRKSGRITEALVGGAFGLFALSHLLNLLGIATSDLLIITLRTTAYLVVIYALLRVASGHTYG
ncbi:MAG TPA: hypothetical protein PK089_07620 [Methanoregulaceae archaeon]|nr:hypothetical protein [Methanoregulaceae archaeon]HQJ87521.1 hypothetical protein [Methanoregulaceae archaeon]